MKEADPRVVELLERFIRERYARGGGKQHAAYLQVADALEAAKAQEREARLAWEQARNALAAAQREMDDFWADFERSMNEEAPALREEVTALLRELRRRHS